MSRYASVSGKVTFKSDFFYNLLSIPLLRYWHPVKKTFVDEGGEPLGGMIDNTTKTIELPSGQLRGILDALECLNRLDFEGELFGHSLDGGHDFFYWKKKFFHTVDINDYARQKGLEEVDFDANVEEYEDQLEKVCDAFKEDPLCSANSLKCILNKKKK